MKRVADGTPRVLFVTREPVVHTFHGAIAAVHNLLQLMVEHGCEVTVLVTGGASRSPRLLFHEAVPLPQTVRLCVPGYRRVGRWWLRPASLRGWSRLLLRAADRCGWGTDGLLKILRALRIEVFDRAWDLTEPTAEERALVVAEFERMRPDAVVANYALWGPVLKEVRTRENPIEEAGESPTRTLILMHDVLAEHVRRFEERGLPLDCNRITTEMETAWLDGADAVIAIQAEEAAAVKERVGAEVLLQPIRLVAEPASASPDALRCLFVGSNSPPNVQGLRWLLDRVWPLVLVAEPRAILAVAGSVCERAGALPRGVELMGRLRSLDREHRRAAVCVVPLLVGSGLKMKLLEALRFGKATVSTSVGVQGLRGWVEDAVAVTDVPERFAAEILQLLRDGELRRRRERAAAGMVQRHFGAGTEAERRFMVALCARASGGREQKQISPLRIHNGAVGAPVEVTGLLSRREPVLNGP